MQPKPDIRTDHTVSQPKDEDSEFAQALHDQEELGGVDSSLTETMAAMRLGRESVIQKLNQQSASRSSEITSEPLALIRAGREQILNKLRQPSAPGNEASNEAMADLNRQLSEKLTRLTSSIPQDRIARQTVEIEIQSAIRAYSTAIRRLLRPMTFSR